MEKYVKSGAVGAFVELSRGDDYDFLVMGDQTPRFPCIDHTAYPLN